MSERRGPAVFENPGASSATTCPFSGLPRNERPGILDRSGKRGGGGCRAALRKSRRALLARCTGTIDMSRGRGVQMSLVKSALAGGKRSILVAAFLLAVVGFAAVLTASGGAEDSSGLDCPDGFRNTAVFEQGAEYAPSPEDSVMRTEILTQLFDLPPQERRMGTGGSARGGIVRSDNRGRPDRASFQVFLDSKPRALVTSVLVEPGKWRVTTVEYCPSAGSSD